MHLEALEALRNALYKFKTYLLTYLLTSSFRNEGGSKILFSQEILKYTERAGLDAADLKKAVEVMRVVPKAANDMMNVGRLQGFEVRRRLCFVGKTS